jgi:hypothetical protein
MLCTGILKAFLNEDHTACKPSLYTNHPWEIYRNAEESILTKQTDLFDCQITVVPNTKCVCASFCNVFFFRDKTQNAFQACIVGLPYCSTAY